MSVFQTIKTSRLALRAFEPADAAALAAYRNLPEVAALQTWEGFSIKDAQNLIAQMQILEQPTADQWYQIAVTLEGKLIGDLAFKLGDRQAEIGFSFDPAFQKQGFAFEALQALLEFAFGTLQLHRVHATTDPRNVNSMRLLEKLNFRKEGHLLENFWFKGAWVDDLIYGLLAREWHS
jgi:RimJ/RimL family protein N-acetyltransferase